MNTVDNPPSTNYIEYAHESKDQRPGWCYNYASFLFIKYIVLTYKIHTRQRKSYFVFCIYCGYPKKTKRNTYDIQQYEAKIKVFSVTFPTSTLCATCSKLADITTNPLMAF